MPNLSPKKFLSILAGLCLLAYVSMGQNLRIYHIDVDQADATLFVTPSGSTLLVDAGKNGHGSRIKRVMQQAGVSHIDHFVNTHYHEDHYGGIDDLVIDPDITVGTAYDRGDKNHLPVSKLNERTYRDYDSLIGHRAIMLTRGMQILVDNTISVTCISHGGAVLGEQNPDTGMDENDMSISLLIRYGNFWVFLGGDIESHTETKIAEHDLVMNVDLYQANHHGSHTSSSRSFMEDLTPSVVVISNGNNNSYYHPRQISLDTYSRLTPTPIVLQTNKYLGGRPGAGNVNDQFIADLDADGDDGTILIDVNLNQNQYTVSYRNQSHDFTIKNRGSILVQPRQVVIERLLPNPVGSDTDLESITIANRTGSSILLSGWMLRDASGRVWALDGSGSIPANQALRIVRNGMPMSLNNEGDLIQLIGPDNTIIDEFQYVGSLEGIEIMTNH